MRKRIFIGYTDIAGVGSRLEEGFQKLGHKANFYFYGKHPFNYTGGTLLKLPKGLYLNRVKKMLFLIKMLFGYDYFIYIGRGTGLLKKAKEVKLFNFFGKKTMIIYVGCDVRIPEIVEKYKWNTCVKCPQTYKDYVGCVIESKKKRIREEENLYTHIMSPLECGGYIKRRYRNILFPVNTKRFESVKKNSKESDYIRIIHAPSNMAYKGSEYIISAVNKLKKDYNIEFELVQNVSIEELYDKIKESDLVIDQLLGGFYGLFAIESMMLGKPVVCYLRDDAVEYKSPIINANPDTIYDVLFDILKSPEELKEIGFKSKKYVEKYHADAFVCQSILNYFNNDKS